MWGSRRSMTEADFAVERDRMVKDQIVARGVKDPQVLDVLRRVPRHHFVLPETKRQAYEDHPVLIGCGQTISQPYMVALMTELLELKPQEKVLEIGTGSGYQTAILAELAAEVVSIERNEPLADRARACLESAGYDNVTVLVGDGTLGWPEDAPYDAILVTAGSPQLPSSLEAQLAMGGRLVCPVGSRDIQKLLKVVRTTEGFREEAGISCVFVPLLGAEGWEG